MAPHPHCPPIPQEMGEAAEGEPAEEEAPIAQAMDLDDSTLVKFFGKL